MRDMLLLLVIWLSAPFLCHGYESNEIIRLVLIIIGNLSILGAIAHVAMLWAIHQNTTPEGLSLSAPDARSERQERFNPVVKP